MSACIANGEKNYPAPTEGKTILKLDGDESAGYQKRVAWIEAMHKAAPGVNWQYLESQNRMQMHQSRLALRALRSGGMEEIADGKLTGEWHERGSNNQAGSVVSTAFDPDTEDIWLISAGGSLFKGNLNGNKWEVVNQDLNFDGDLLQFLPIPNGRRLVAIIDKVVHFSDDDGLSWTPSMGLETYDNNWGARKDPIVLQDSANTILVLVQEWLPGPWISDVGIYRSLDRGLSFEKAFSFQNGNLDNFTLCLISGTNEVAVMEKVSPNLTRFYKLSNDLGIPELVTTNPLFGVGSVRANLEAIDAGGIPVFYTYNSSNQLFQSSDWGTSWQPKATLEERPWQVGIFISPTNPFLVLMGGVHCHRSTDGGGTFQRFNDWWDYYDDVDGSLHADMMYFKEYYKKDGTPFILISNHGGLNVTYDGVTVQNLGLKGLNVGQYYDVVTDPNDELFIFAGSQDQGFQRAFDYWEDDILPFDQAISGDYGHMAFTGYGQNLWMVYPGGWITFWNSPTGGGVSASWELESDDESVWIPPLIADPDPGKNVVYLAGGNKNGGSGSYIIQLSFLNNQIESEQLPFDFKAFSGGEVSAIAFSPLNDQRMYAATTNGYFFTSNDKGQTWDPSITAVPGGQYLYGAAILPSRIDPEKVYFGGSGYSNPAMFVSKDGGTTFSSMNEGLPPTLVMDLASDVEETRIFAATEAGPFVYLFSEEKWFSMAGTAAPLQRYWSVEYLPLQNRVRFGTYGRGIWDFQIEESVSTTHGVLSGKEEPFDFWPNPLHVGQVLNVRAKSLTNGLATVNLHTISGQIIWSGNIQINRGGVATVVLPQHLTPQSYLLEIRQGKQNRVSKLIIMGG